MNEEQLNQPIEEFRLKRFQTLNTWLQGYIEFRKTLDEKLNTELGIIVTSEGFWSVGDKNGKEATYQDALIAAIKART